MSWGLNISKMRSQELEVVFCVFTSSCKQTLDFSNIQSQLFNFQVTIPQGFCFLLCAMNQMLLFKVQGSSS